MLDVNFKAKMCKKVDDNVSQGKTFNSDFVATT